MQGSKREISGMVALNRAPFDMRAAARKLGVRIIW
jgi:hypothetical protein